MSIRDFIDGLSEDERLAHSDLITECLRQEENLKALDLKDQISRLNNIHLDLDNFNKRTEEFNEVLQVLIRELENYYVATVPDENTYEGLDW
jgi:hypothetical protein